MQETEFIAQNKEKWKELEEILDSNDKDPARLTTLFIETTDDLSYSRTYYPNRSVRVYLNSIAQKVYSTIYRKNKKGKNGISEYLKEQLPSALFQTRDTLLLAFVIFCSGILIGIFSDIYYPEFARVVLGEYYVEMTKSNIENNDPMQVYKNEEAVEMFVRIAINNIQISFGIFVLGLLWGVGTTYVLLSNGVMFGAFMHFFFSRGLGVESFLTVMQHGTLELSMIVLSGSAGFILSKSILFPGTYSRLEALVLASAKAVRIMIAVFVLLIYAALIEAFLTRYTEIPNAIRALSILLSVLIVAGYFVIYPYLKYRKAAPSVSNNEEIPLFRKTNIILKKIKSSAILFNESLYLFGKQTSKLAKTSFFIALGIGVCIAIYTNGNFEQIYDLNDLRFSFSYIFWAWFPFQFLINTNIIEPIYIFLLVGFSVISIVSYSTTTKELSIHQSSSIKKFFNALLIGGIAILPTHLSPFLTFFLMLFTWPFCMLWLISTFEKRAWMWNTLRETVSLYAHGFSRIMGTFFTVHGIQYIILLTVNGALVQVFGWLFTGKPLNILYLIFEFISINIPRTFPFATEVPYAVYSVILLFALFIAIPISIISTLLVYHSLLESTDAQSLKKSISFIGAKKRAYGLEKEA